MSCRFAWLVSALDSEQGSQQPVVDIVEDVISGSYHGVAMQVCKDALVLTGWDRRPFKQHACLTLNLFCTDLTQLLCTLPIQLVVCKLEIQVLAAVASA